MFAYSDVFEVPSREEDVLVVEFGPYADKQALLTAVASALRFPSYFGYNWDAFEECLNDLSWLKERGVVLIHRALPLPSHTSDMAMYLSILRSSFCGSSGKCIVAVFPVLDRSNVEALLDV